MDGVRTRLYGPTLVVHIPMRFQRRGGRKRIMPPDGREIVPSSKPQPDGTLVKALARAWRWQRMLDDGVRTSVTEISEAEGINKSYVSRIDPAAGPAGAGELLRREQALDECRGSGKRVRSRSSFSYAGEFLDLVHPLALSSGNSSGASSSSNGDGSSCRA